MIVETHELAGNFDERYLGPLTEHFPAYRMLGESDAERLRAVGVRAVGVFARDETALIEALAPGLRSGGRAAGALAAGVRVPRLRGAVDELRFDGSRMRLSGWCQDPVTSPDAVELSTPANGPADAPFGTLAVAEASRNEFEFDCEAPLVESPLVRLDVSAFTGPDLLGTMSAYWSPDSAAEGELLALTVAHGLLEPLGRYRAVDSFESALDWDRGTGLLQRLVPSLLPGARVRSAGDELPIRFDDGEFDVVIAHDAVVREASITELHRVTRPGAYLALSVLGELARRFGEPGISRADLIGHCAALFDVINYVEGGVAGLHDLIVLRRP